MPPSQGPPVPASPNAAWTPGKPLCGGWWIRSQQGYQSPVAYVACEVTPRYTPGHPWNDQGLERSPLTRPRKKSNECYFGSAPTWAKVIAFIGSLKGTCTPKACQARCMNTYIYIVIYIYGCESKLCMERSVLFRTYGTKGLRNWSCSGPLVWWNIGFT